MASARTVGLLLAALTLGCESGDHTGDASNGASTDADDTRALVAQMAASYEHQLTHRCECLVEQDLLYDSVDACLTSIGWVASGEECLAAAFDEHGTDALRSALRCHVGHIEDANACADAVSCEELIRGGVCDATYAENPCGDGLVSLGTFVIDRCPELSLFR